MAVTLATKITLLLVLAAGSLLSFVMKKIHNALAIMFGIGALIILLWILIGL